jgi:hypothetical protein
MYTGLLGLHSLLRWFILILLIINIFRSLVEADLPYTETDKKWNLRLLIIAHINLLVGFYQYFFGPKGFTFFTENGVSAVMKNAEMRFFAVEHITGMIIAVVLITVSRSVAKKDIPPIRKNKKLATLYILAFIIILASIPWPFRFEDVPWFRGFNAGV